MQELQIPHNLNNITFRIHIASSDFSNSTLILMALVLTLLPISDPYCTIPDIHTNTNQGHLSL